MGMLRMLWSTPVTGHTLPFSVCCVGRFHPIRWCHMGAHRLDKKTHKRNNEEGERTACRSELWFMKRVHSAIQHALYSNTFGLYADWQLSASTWAQSYWRNTSTRTRCKGKQRKRRRWTQHPHKVSAVKDGASWSTQWFGAFERKKSDLALNNAWSSMSCCIVSKTDKFQSSKSSLSLLSLRYKGKHEQKEQQLCCKIEWTKIRRKKK